MSQMRGWVTDSDMWLFLPMCKPLMGIFKTQGLQVQFHTHDPSGCGVMLACFMLTEQISCLLIMKSVFGTLTKFDMYFYFSGKPESFPSKMLVHVLLWIPCHCVLHSCDVASVPLSSR